MKKSVAEIRRLGFNLKSAKWFYSVRNVRHDVDEFALQTFSEMLRSGANGDILKIFEQVKRHFDNDLIMHIYTHVLPLVLKNKWLNFRNFLLDGCELCWKISLDNENLEPVFYVETIHNFRHFQKSCFTLKPPKMKSLYFSFDANFIEFNLKASVSNGYDFQGYKMLSTRYKQALVNAVECVKLNSYIDPRLEKKREKSEFMFNVACLEYNPQLFRTVVPIVVNGTLTISENLGQFPNQLLIYRPSRLEYEQIVDEWQSPYVNLRRRSDVFNKIDVMEYEGYISIISSKAVDILSRLPTKTMRWNGSLQDIRKFKSQRPRYSFDQALKIY
jgi:hypothetical protein